MLRRNRFDDLARRQLDLFATDESELIAEAEDADAAWTNASSDDSEELFGDYQLIVDAVGERLYDVRETYASTLDERTAKEYRQTFNRAASKRFRPYVILLEED